MSADVIAGIAEPNRIFSGPVTFLKSAPKLEFLPDPTVPEIAFAGRSNVGKSSLINALVNRNNLARASNTPGRTQELNFFDVGEPALFRIVDMPGYGYAKAPIKTVQQWRYLINDYLRGRAVLKRVFVLIDSRHGIKEVDHEIMKMLDAAAISYRIVLTKTDKIKASEREAVEVDTMAKLRKHVAAYPELSVTSAEKRGGIDELRAAVLEAVAS
ncbi:ribosome biogenesis GTP-binding protein YihA/YsxC [Sphingorhabdus sp.]|uniref:ribosome biogenesis GTP-binding protein YihA/YsxC n=1 Tax=Sphingorhabdus sp. TaxID=1902408 RepID=UPI000BDD4E1A|nr:ribosome biogenesis GTP-binding protein YihA/YsxC [Sphingorhabdus sp.]OYY15378.1 MAG: YihA family ribosome biogenesis GTP-binding protein [Sphingomonadales bacterium 35-56-22]OYY97131.1 MAG: YihA family ribosome biogenesis GTP-binding protein [Sphingomonadales bacterium 28-56-43]OYZ60284.1 MAG: YihA family ribosome biogenesis GTP-binding protein [Sphingomonadales bacterium 24-56-14]OZA82876.1 MAG: YihA family ribosome biogenesis GTP-binding protein [Sphingomonadales bacterium 39-57-19]HQS13